MEIYGGAYFLSSNTVYFVIYLVFNILLWKDNAEFLLTFDVAQHCRCLLLILENCLAIKFFLDFNGSQLFGKEIIVGFYSIFVVFIVFSRFVRQGCFFRFQKTEFRYFVN